ncbi:hypothetical protein Tco_1293193 [Tanacetum coccineum]
MKRRKKKKVVRRKLKAAERRCLEGKEQQQESSKKQRMEEDKEIDEVEEVEEDDEAELKKHLVIKKDDDIAIDVIPLATKPSVIVDYKLLKEGIMGIDREDLLTLWKFSQSKCRFVAISSGNLTLHNLRNRSRIGINKWYQSFALRNFDLEDMELESTNSGTTAKLPILKLENGDSWVSIPQTTQENGTSVTKMSIPVTAEEKTNKKDDVKARGLLVMALPNEHQLTFSQYLDAKSMFAAIETIFGGNAATKKTQKTLLKQQYENFSTSSGEYLDSIFNRLQKIVSRLAILGVVIAQEDLNLKFLSSLPHEWNTHVVNKLHQLVEFHNARFSPYVSFLFCLINSNIFFNKPGSDTKWYQSFALRNFDLEDMEFESTNSTTAKLPILKLGEYEMWVIRIKQYFQIQDYAL